VEKFAVLNGLERIVDSPRGKGFGRHLGEGTAIHRDQGRVPTMLFTAAQLVDGVQTLKSLPAAYINIKRVIDDPKSSTNDLASAISADPALTARVLRLVNSPLYGFNSKIETVSRALVVLGIQQIHDLALATSVAAVFKSARLQHFDMERFWRESVYCALAARSVAKLCNVLDSERLFVAGLLHGLGTLVMFDRAPQEAAEAMRQAGEGRRSVIDVQREIVGCDYAEVGAQLARRWNLPANLCSAIAYHIQPDAATAPAVIESITHIGYWVMRAVQDDVAPESWAIAVSPAAWAITGLTAECFSLVRMQADAQFAETLAMLADGASKAA
jgi:HD-like signal output (HDOD) protein